MGPLKDELHIAVWKFLRTQPRCHTLLTTLNQPTSGSREVRDTWNELKANGRNEGYKKSQGLKDVLQERPDLFAFLTTDRGHLHIGLTEGAAILDPADGLPPCILAPEGSTIQEGVLFDTEGSKVTEEELASAKQAEVELAHTNATDPSHIPQMVPPPPGGAGGPLGMGPIIIGGGGKKEKKGKGKGKFNDDDKDPYAPVWGPYGYQDIVWTPEIQIKKDMRKALKNMMIRALYKAVEMHGGSGVTLSQLGADYKVSELKKDPYLKSWKLLDILSWKECENVFEMQAAAGVTGGVAVKLQPGAEAALPNAEEAAEIVDMNEAMLPERIESPKNLKDKHQALRIELIHALHRRGGRVAIQELGQEIRVQEKKKMLHQGKKLIDLVRLWPDNFKLSQVHDEASGNTMVDLLSQDVNDQSMIDHAIRKTTEALPSRDGGRGSKNNDRDRRDRDRDRDRRDRDRDRVPRDLGYGSSTSSRSSPYDSSPPPAYGYGYGHPGAPPPGYGPAPGYGPPPGYGAPPGVPPGYPPGYGAPPPGYPPPGYGAPPHDPSAYGAPPPMAPPPGAPPPGAPPPGGPPPDAYGAPPPGAPPPGAPPGYPPPAGQPPPGYPPPPGQAHPPAGYGAPPPGYPGYSQPAPGYPHSAPPGHGAPPGYDPYASAPPPGYPAPDPYRR
eukprot:TRINITY_DN1535_c1_g1_i1.p1 TRINITY_DN1535_c1_g1~~TRINITY_DN1535_c1_g1_i1.p1  ORF type:complete len:668 (+),score=120.52 TRINITY_DN1535_c1_g1_i1:48-2051(+)